MVERSRAKGLDVRTDDAVSVLTAAEDQTFGAVIANQVIEHLPYDELLAFFRTAPLKLKPGGLLIVETVNPHAPQALGRRSGWDLTRPPPDLSRGGARPLPPERLCRGLRLSDPGASGDAERDRFEAADYAVVARVADCS